MNYYPAPNNVGRADGRDNFFSNAIRSDVFSGYMGRLDYNVSDRHKLCFSTCARTIAWRNRFENIVTGNFLSRVNYGMTFDDVYTFTPTFILNTRAGWTRFTEGNVRPHDGFDFLSLGFPANLAQSSAKSVFPRIEMSNGATSIGDSGGDRTRSTPSRSSWPPPDRRRAFTFKFGTDLRQQRDSSNSFGNSSGRYEFNARNWTRGAGLQLASGAERAGYGGAANGDCAGGNWQVNATRTQSANYYAVFLPRMTGA